MTEQERRQKIMKIKMNILTLENKITELINNSRSRFAQEEGFGIAVGLDILNSYLGSICKRAIEINDPIIMCDLLNIGVLIPDSEEEERAIRKRAEESKKK